MGNWTVDIIIPTYRPDDGFCLLLQSLQKQTFPVSKLILANTEEQHWKDFIKKKSNQQVLKSLPFPLDVFHVSKEEFDHGGTRRLAVEHSNGTFFLCMTQDALPVNSFLIEKIMEPFQDAEMAVVYGRQLPRKGASEVERFTRSFNYPARDRTTSNKDLESLGIKTFFCSNVCAVYRRSIYDALDGFEEHTIFNEDMIFAGHAIRAGYKIGYASEAKVVHSHSYNGKQQFQRNFDLAVSQKQHPEVFQGVKSESEGIAMVKKTMSYLWKRKKPWLIPGLIWQSGCKYLGYLAGMNYEKLSLKLRLRFTMNKEYWS